MINPIVSTRTRMYYLRCPHEQCQRVGSLATTWLQLGRAGRVAGFHGTTPRRVTLISRSDSNVHALEDAGVDGTHEIGADVYVGGDLSWLLRVRVEMMGPGQYETV